VSGSGRQCSLWQNSHKCSCAHHPHTDHCSGMVHWHSHQWLQCYMIIIHLNPVEDGTYASGRCCQWSLCQNSHKCSCACHQHTHHCLGRVHWHSHQCLQCNFIIIHLYPVEDRTYGSGRHRQWSLCQNSHKWRNSQQEHIVHHWGRVHWHNSQ